jgi:hypothetical protein
MPFDNIAVTTALKFYLPENIREKSMDIPFTSTGLPNPRTGHIDCYRWVMYHGQKP